MSTRRIPKDRSPRTQSTTRNLHREAYYQSPCRPKAGTAINSATTPSTPATSAFLPAAALLLGADDDADGALALALAPVDDPPEAVAVVEPEASVVVDVAVVVDDAVVSVVEVTLSEMVGREKSPELVLEPPMMPVGVDVGVPSAALVAQ